MKKTISHILIVLSFVSFIAGCERDEPFLSESVALNALELQLTSTRASDLTDPTLIIPNDRLNWVLEVQIEENDVAEYVFSASKLLWVPRSEPAYFPAGTNSNGCDVTFTLHPLYDDSYALIGQNGSAAGLLEADTLKNTLLLKPTDIIHNISLAHANSMIEIVCDSSIENRSVELIIVEGDSIYPYSIDHKKYVCIVPNGINDIVVISKVDGEEDQKSLSFDFGTQSNTRYVFLLPDPAFCYSPVVVPWAGDAEVDATASKKFIHIEGYDGVIRLMISGVGGIQFHPELYFKKGGAIYSFPLAMFKNEMIHSLTLESYSENILIGRNTDDFSMIKLKVGSDGKLLLRKESDGTIPINITGELLLINTCSEATYRQEANIDLSCIPGKNWTTPIGSFAIPFKGTYDGNGYAIHSLNMDVKQIIAWNPDKLENLMTVLRPYFRQYYWALPAGAVGLFGVNQGTIKNVHITSGLISLSKINRETGKSIALSALCGYNDGGYITDCTNKARLEIDSISVLRPYLYDSYESYDMFSVGGICGTSRGNIENSINYGDIDIKNGYFRTLPVGGICGNLYARYQTDNIHINSCINYGNVSFNNLTFERNDGVSMMCGGIVGMTNFFNYNASNFKETIQHISNCHNNGNIRDKGTKRTFGEFAGIVAKMYYPLSEHSSKMSACYSMGAIKVNRVAPDLTTVDTDPIVCAIFVLFDPKSPIKIPVEHCFYNATMWEGQGDRFYNDECYYPNWDNTSSRELNVFRRTVDKEILNSTPGFSADSWPNSDIWDNKVWADFGGWNNGNPVYPKLRIEMNK
jgi:hypothetical protein